MQFLNKWLKFYILSYLPIKDIKSFCQTNKTNQQIYKNNIFWEFLTKKNFENFQNNPSNNPNWFYYRYMRLSSNKPKIHHIMYDESRCSIKYLDIQSRQKIFGWHNNKKYNSNTFKRIRDYILSSNGDLLKYDVIKIYNTYTCCHKFFDGNIIRDTYNDYGFGLDLNEISLHYWKMISNTIYLKKNSIKNLIIEKISDNHNILSFIHNEPHGKKIYIINFDDQCFTNEEINHILTRINNYNYLMFYYCPEIPIILKKKGLNINNTISMELLIFNM